MGFWVEPWIHAQETHRFAMTTQGSLATGVSSFDTGHTFKGNGALLKGFYSKYLGANPTIKRATDQRESPTQHLVWALDGAKPITPTIKITASSL